MGWLEQLRCWFDEFGAITYNLGSFVYVDGLVLTLDQLGCSNQSLPWVFRPNWTSTVVGLFMGGPTWIMWFFGWLHCFWWRLHHLEWPWLQETSRFLLLGRVDFLQARVGLGRPGSFNFLDWNLVWIFELQIENFVFLLRSVRYNSWLIRFRCLGVTFNWPARLLGWFVWSTCMRACALWHLRLATFGWVMTVILALGSRFLWAARFWPNSFDNFLFWF